MSAGHWDAEQTSRAMRIEEIGGSDCRQTHERERKPAGLKSSGRPGSMENLDTRAAYSAEGGDHRSEAPSVGRGNQSRLHHRLPVGRSLGGCPWEQTRPERAPRGNELGAQHADQAARWLEREPSTGSDRETKHKGVAD
jgi:hypothetical protein